MNADEVIEKMKENLDEADGRLDLLTSDPMLSGMFQPPPQKIEFESENS